MRECLQYVWILKITVEVSAVVGKSNKDLMKNNFNFVNYLQILCQRFHIN